MVKIRTKTQIKVLFRPKSWWIGVHHSDKMNQTCINILPCITIRVRWKSHFKLDLVTKNYSI